MIKRNILFIIFMYCVGITSTCMYASLVPYSGSDSESEDEGEREVEVEGKDERGDEGQQLRAETSPDSPSSKSKKKRKQPEDFESPSPTVRKKVEQVVVLPTPNEKSKLTIFFERENIGRVYFTPQTQSRAKRGKLADEVPIHARVQRNFKIPARKGNEWDHIITKRLIDKVLTYGVPEEKEGGRIEFIALVAIECDGNIPEYFEDKNEIRASFGFSSEAESSRGAYLLYHFCFHSSSNSSSNYNRPVTGSTVVSTSSGFGITTVNQKTTARRKLPVPFE